MNMPMTSTLLGLVVHFQSQLDSTPRFTKIIVKSYVVSWLHKIAKVCRLAGYSEDHYTLFTSTLLEGTPQSLFDVAEHRAMKIGAVAHASFLGWHNFKDWCEAKAESCQPLRSSKDAIANLKQIGTIAT